MKYRVIEEYNICRYQWGRKKKAPVTIQGPTISNIGTFFTVRKMWYSSGQRASNPFDIPVCS